MSFYRRPTYIIFSLKNHITLEKFPLSIFSVNPCSLAWVYFESYYSLTLCYNITFASKRQVYLFFSKYLVSTFYWHHFCHGKGQQIKTLSIYKRKIHNRFTFDNSFKYFATGKLFLPHLILIVRQAVSLTPFFLLLGTELFFFN